LVGSWAFTGTAALPGVYVVSAPFVPAFHNSSFKVLSLEGNTESYVELTNNGDLIVTSFTWSADVYPELGDGPLFNWISAPPAPADDYWGTHIWIYQSLLYVSLVHVSGLPTHRFHSHPPLLTKWNKLAVSYDSITRTLQMYVNGHVEQYLAVSSEPISTYGQVMIGSLYYYSKEPKETRAFRGKIACVKLLNIFKDLHSFPSETLRCKHV